MLLVDFKYISDCQADFHFANRFCKKSGTVPGFLQPFRKMEISLIFYNPLAKSGTVSLNIHKYVLSQQMIYSSSG